MGIRLLASTIQATRSPRTASRLRQLVWPGLLLFVWFMTGCRSDPPENTDSATEFVDAGGVADTGSTSAPAPGVAVDSAAVVDAVQTAVTTEFGGPTMGTTWSVRLAESVTGKTKADLQTRLTGELARINQLVSTWDPESELSRFNANPSLAAQSLDSNTLSMLAAAMEVSRLTDGAYDVTIGPVVDIWGFGADVRVQSPSDAELKEALAVTGYQTLTLGKSTVKKQFSGTRIDLSSLAKGDAVDSLADLLEADGYAGFLVEIGGEVRALGRRSDGQPWLVGIEQPDGRVSEGLALTNHAVASSGSYRNYREAKGRRVSHIIDARTGQPIAHDLVAVTVVQADTRVADAWATALLVVGSDLAWKIAIDQDWAVQLTTKTSDGFAIRRTPAFEALVVDR